MRRKTFTTVNFRLDPELHKRLRDKTPNQGDRTRLMTKLVKAFLDGQINFVETISVRPASEQGLGNELIS